MWRFKIVGVASGNPLMHGRGKSFFSLTKPRVCNQSLHFFSATFSIFVPQVKTGSLSNSGLRRGKSEYVQAGHLKICDTTRSIQGSKTSAFFNLKRKINFSPDSAQLWIDKAKIAKSYIEKFSAGKISPNVLLKIFSVFLFHV